MILLYEKKNLISLSTAGGGKTTRLLQRLEEIQSERALVISFTRATCANIQALANVEALTLHSFCYRFLPEKYTICEEISSFISLFLYDFNYNFKELRKYSLEEVSSLVSRYFIFAGEICEKNGLNEELKKLIDLVRSEKERRNILFFPDVILKFYENIEEYLPRIDSTYDHFLLDEAQDLSLPQLEICYSLISSIFIQPSKTFFVVGDVKQSIYEFQGSKKAYYLNFIAKIEELCTFHSQPLEKEENIKTYRFGGEILQKVNNLFVLHKSEKNAGIYEEITVEEPLEYGEALVFLLLQQYENKDIMILYPKSNSFIGNLQKCLKNGLNCKVWLSTSSVVKGLRSLCFYFLTGEKYFKIQFLQSPFFHFCSLKLQFISCHIDYYKNDLFELLTSKKYLAQELLEILSEYLETDVIETQIFRLLYERSFSFTSFVDFIYSLPDYLSIQEEGLFFSTVHSSKGLEKPCVIYFKSEKVSKQLEVSLNPFFVAEQKTEQKISEELEYVAYTRAQQHLIVVNYK